MMGSFLSVVAHRVSASASVVWLAPRKAHPPQGQRFPVPTRCYGSAAATAGSASRALLAREVAYGVPLRCRGRSVRGRGPPRLPLVLVAALVALGAADLEHRLLPNTIVSPASLAGLVLSLRAGRRRGERILWRRWSLRAFCSDWSRSTRAAWGTSRCAGCSACSSARTPRWRSSSGHFLWDRCLRSAGGRGKARTRKPLAFGTFMESGG